MPDDAMTSPEQRAEVEAVKVEQADRMRFHVEGQTSTLGPRWQIWDGERQSAWFQNIADLTDAHKLCDALNEGARHREAAGIKAREAAARVKQGDELAKATAALDAVLHGNLGNTPFDQACGVLIARQGKVILAALRTQDIAQSARPPADQDEVVAVRRALQRAWDKSDTLPPLTFLDGEAKALATAAIEALRPFREAAEAKAREDAAKVVIGAWPLGCAAVCAAIRALPAPPALEQGDAK
jgi:hypothetical protein